MAMGLSTAKKAVSVFAGVLLLKTSKHGIFLDLVRVHNSSLSPDYVTIIYKALFEAKLVI